MSAVNRGRAGKYGKPKRGGGKHFSKDLRPLDAEGVERSMWAEPSGGSGSGSDSSEEDSSSDDGLTARPAKADEGLTREQRRLAAKARKEAAIAKSKHKATAPGDLPTSSEDESSSDDDADMPANPNHTAKAAAQAAKPAPTPASAADGAAAAAAEPPKRKTIKKDTDLSQLSRREREALQAQQAKERYAKLHAAGKTDEARSDLERLKLVRQKRDEEAAIKAAERQEREEQEKSKGDQLAREERMRALAAGKAARGGKAKKGGRA